MSTASDRRAPHAARIPFEAMVEVGGALGPSFEARAVNLSEEGMQLRTAYLPEVGQPVTCRFDAGNGQVVVAAGEVLWNEDLGDGGEFGIRFTNLDTASTAALQRVLGMTEEPAGDAAAPRPVGRKVRLHIEGLASPMRARVKDANDKCLTAFSELGFLQVGKPLELEDAMTGSKRPAVIDGVAVELEQASRIPQLVVSLRYDEEPSHAGLDSEAPVTIEAPTGDAPAPLVMRPSIDMGEAHDVDTDCDDEDDAVDAAPHHDAVAMAAPRSASPSRHPTSDDLSEESEKLKSPFARTAAKVTPALEKWAKRARTTVALLAARRKGGSGDDVAIPMRRTTAPAPGGGLHASGRKVVRGDLDGDAAKAEDAAKASLLTAKVTKKRAAVAGAVGIAMILGLVAMRKPEAPAAAPVDETAAATPAPEQAPAPAPIGTLAAAPVMPAPAPTFDPMAAMAADPPADNDRPRKKLKVVPFGNGAVGRNGNLLRLKMDGAIEKIHGASQPTGFTVVIPDRKSLDAAGPLAAKDPRIAAIRVANEANGAELSVTFKDGVPNYLVRANGDNLELVLARPAQNGDKPAAAHATPKKKPHGKRR